jgi:hypothetical protein
LLIDLVLDQRKLKYLVQTLYQKDMTLSWGCYDKIYVIRLDFCIIVPNMIALTVPKVWTPKWIPYFHGSSENLLSNVYGDQAGARTSG